MQCVCVGGGGGGDIIQSNISDCMILYGQQQLIWLQLLSNLGIVLFHSKCRSSLTSFLHSGSCIIHRYTSLGEEFVVSD